MDFSCHSCGQGMIYHVLGIQTAKAHEASIPALRPRACFHWNDVHALLPQLILELIFIFAVTLPAGREPRRRSAPLHIGPRYRGRQRIDRGFAASSSSCRPGLRACTFRVRLSPASFRRCAQCALASRHRDIHRETAGPIRSREQQLPTSLRVLHRIPRLHNARPTILAAHRHRIIRWLRVRVAR
jgi:hypothetical protein